MSIRVQCEQGHRFKVKAKYAGKTGKCPTCKAAVQVPIVVSAAVAMGDSILDEAPLDRDSGSDLSNVGARVHNTEACPMCGKAVPIWHCKCDDCGHRFAGR